MPVLGLGSCRRNGDVTDTATGEKCIAIKGKTIGTPSRANVSTLVYAYVW